MADSNITVDSLELAAGIDYNVASWTFTDPNALGIEQLRLDAVELYAAQANNRGPDNDLIAELVAEGRDSAPHFALGQSTTRFYWARARNKAGFHGDWFPSGQTSGVQGTTAVISPGESGLPFTWVTYTPTLEVSAGALGATANVTGRYVVSGDIVFLNISFDITNNGTGSGQLRASLPPAFNAASSAPASVGSGRRTSDAKMLRASVGDTGGGGFVDKVLIFLYDGTYPGVSGSTFSISLVYRLSPGWSVFDTFAVTAGSGTFTSIVNKHGVYKRLGSVVFFNFDFTIAINGTAGGHIIVETPVPLLPPQSPQGAVGTNGGVQASGYVGQVVPSVQLSTIIIQGYDGTYLGQNGAAIRGSIVYNG